MPENVNIGASPLDAANLTTEVSGAQQTMETPTTGPIVKGPTVKGGISVPGNVALDPTQTAELLANMQSMIDKRTGGWNDFMSGMQDTMAMATPQRLGGPTQAMAQRAATKRQEQEDIFNMRAQMASLKAGQAQAQAQADWAGKFIGGGGGAGGTGAGGAGGNVFDSMSEGARARINSVPPGSAQQYAIIQEELKKLGDVQTKSQYDAAANTPQKYWVEGHGELSLTPNQFRTLPKDIRDQIDMATFKKFGYVPNTSTPGLTQAAKGAPNLYQAEGVAKELGIPITSGYRSTEKQAQIEANKQPGQLVARPGYSQHQHGNAIDVQWDKLTPEQQSAALTRFDRPFPQKDPGHLVLKGAPKITAPVQVAGPAQAPSQVAPVARTQAAMTPSMPNERDYPSKQAYDAAVEDWKSKNKEVYQAQGAGLKKETEAEGNKHAEYNESVGTADKTFSEFDKLLKVSKGNKNVFNLSGKGIINPILDYVLPDVKDGESHDPNRKLMKWTLNNPEQTAYKAVKQGEATAQASWAKNLVAGAGGRLTNADLALGSVAKGVGTDQTYESHMYNLAQNMEAARTVYYRGLEYKDWKEKHPNAPISDFENSEAYRVTSKVKAAKDVAAKFKDVPEVISTGGESSGAYIHLDKNGKQYIVVDGKGYYL